MDAKLAVSFHNRWIVGADDVVNAGIGGNRITGPTPYDPKTPFAGGPSALDRLERDVLSLSGLATVIWLEGINDLSSAPAPTRSLPGSR
jgi:hypothetical protein